MVMSWSYSFQSKHERKKKGGHGADRPTAPQAPAFKGSNPHTHKDGPGGGGDDAASNLSERQLLGEY